MDHNTVSQCAAFDKILVKNKKYITRFLSRSAKNNCLTAESAAYIYSMLSVDLQKMISIMQLLIWNTPAGRNAALVERIILNLRHEHDMVNFCKFAIQHEPYYIRTIPTILKNNIEVATTALTTSLDYLPQYTHLCDNEVLFDRLLPNAYFEVMRWVGDNIKCNKKLMLKAVSRSRWWISYIKPPLNCDIDIINVAIDKEPRLALHIIDIAHHTYTNIMRAISIDGYALKYCKNKELFNNYTICRTAILGNCETLELIDDSSSFYEDLCIEALFSNSNAIYYISKKFCSKWNILQVYFHKVKRYTHKDNHSITPKCIIECANAYPKYTFNSIRICITLIGW